MDLLFSYSQEKIEKKSGNPSSCDLKLYSDDSCIYYQSTFNSTYRRFGEKKHICFEHEFKISLINGDVDVTYRIINNGLTPEKLFKSTVKVKKNDFKLLDNLIDNGIVRGEKKIGYWGVKYYNAVDTIFKLVYDILKPKLKTPYFLSKTYTDKDGVGCLFELIVDYHLDCKNIKGSDNVYGFIQYDYPKQKWLRKNDNKYLPSVLDSYGIKSKFLIGELNDNDCILHIKSLNYICKLFGENYIDYLKQIPWKSHCYNLPQNNKVHQLKNDAEKKVMIQLIKNWEKNKLYSESFVQSINKLLSIREDLEKLDYDLKFTAKTDNDYDNLLEIWLGHKSHHSRGYKLKYNFDLDFIKNIEEPIIINDEVYIPKILQTEDDFRIEGYIMKNCMAKQFLHGTIYVFVSLTHNKKKRINLQYRKGLLIQSFAKANTEVPENLKIGIDTLTKRFENYPNVTWTKDRYDFIEKNK